MLGSVGAVSLSPALLQASITDPDLPRATPAFAAQVHLAPWQAAGSARFASVLGGLVEGPRLQGRVEGGRIEWRVPAQGAPAEIIAQLSVVRADGRRVELRDRFALPASEVSVCGSAPEIVGDSEEGALPCLLVGRVDVAALEDGLLRLRVFEVS